MKKLKLNSKLSQNQVWIAIAVVFGIGILTVAGIAFSGNLFQGNLKGASTGSLIPPTTPQQKWQASCDDVVQHLMQGDMTQYVNSKITNKLDSQAIWAQVQKCMDQFTNQCVQMTCYGTQKGWGAFSAWLSGQSTLVKMKARYCAKVNYYGAWGTCPRWAQQPQSPFRLL